ncbi:MAG: TonB-dependent receptor [Proteobacteria bacterium]|nr:TonB-dependent receptor [Pseudomonadota bacterium]
MTASTRRLLACALAFLSASPGASRAQETLEEVVVTAQKRSQNLQDVPVAVDAFSGAALAESGAVQPLDLALVTPNLTTKNAVGNTAPIFALRGLSLNDFATNGTQPVGVYLDEVYLVNNSQLAFQMMDLERVEVLKGPQGTLYGRNTTAGAVNFITNKPTPAFDAGVSVTAGEWELFGTEAYVNGALGDHVSGRVAVAGERQMKGFFVNDTTGENWGQSRRANWRGQILWDLGTTHVLLNLHGGIDKSDDWYYKYIADASGLPLGAQLAQVAASGNPDIFHGQHTISPQPYIDNLSNGLTATVDHDFGAQTLKSITSIESLEYARTEDYGSVPFPVGWNYYPGHLLQYSEEIRVTSNGDHNWNWILGLFAGHDRLKESDVYNELDNPIYEGYIFNEKYTQNVTNFALFTHNEIRLADSLRLTVGLRYTDEQKRYVGGTLVAQSDPTLAFDTCPCTVDTTLHYHEPTGKLGLDWRIGDALLYVSASRGYKSGGVTGFYVTDVGAKAPYNPEFINAYEAGFKSSWLDRKLRLNGALFYYDYKDLQAFGVIPNEQGFPEFRIFNVAKSRVQGGELEASWLPVAGLKIDLGVGLLDTKVVESAVGGVDVGNRLGNAPNLEVDSSISYRWSLSSSLTATAAVDANWRGGTFYYVQNTPDQFQAAYVLVDPRLTLSGPGDVWKLSLWAKNATNKRYYREIFNDGGSVIGFPAAPRQIGLTYSYRWQ